MDCRLILEESLLIESDVMNIKTPVQILAAFQGSAFGVALVNHDNNQHGPNQNLNSLSAAVRSNSDDVLFGFGVPGGVRGCNFD